MFATSPVWDPMSLLMLLSGGFGAVVVLVMAVVWFPKARSAFCRLGALLDRAVYGEGYEPYDVRGLILTSADSIRPPTIGKNSMGTPLWIWTTLSVVAASTVWGWRGWVLEHAHVQSLAVGSGIALAIILGLVFLGPSWSNDGRTGVFLFPRSNRVIRWLARYSPLLEPLAYHNILRQVSRKHGFLCVRDFLQATLIGSSKLTVHRAWGILIDAPGAAVSGDTLDDWAHQSDDLADAALEEVVEAQSENPDLPQDYLTTISVLAQNPGYPGCQAFWAECTSLPSTSLTSVGPARPNPQAWTESEKVAIEDGQHMFFRYSTGLLVAMLHASLATGFALPRMVRVLETTGYLLGKRSPVSTKEPEPAQSDKTWDRLIQTTSWVVDAMQCGAEGLLPAQAQPEAGWTEGGKGWREVVKVRLIHARVRRFVLSRSKTSSDQLYDRGFVPARDGIPINQADMAATLGAFCAVPLVALAQLGLSVPRKEEEAYVAVWRVIGFYSGVRPEIIQRYFASAPASQAFTASAAVHLASLPPLPPDPTIPKDGASIAVRLLDAVANRPPAGLPLNAHIALVRYLAGPDLSLALGLPVVPPSVQWGSLWVYKALVAIPPTVGRWHRRAFERKRLALAQMLIPALFRAQGKAARTKLGSNHLPSPETLGPDASSTPDVDWKKIRRLHLQVTIEMGAVVVAVVTAPFWTMAAILFVTSVTR